MSSSKRPPDLKDETRSIHTGRGGADHFGVVNTPVYRASTILHPTLESLEANAMPFSYGRRGTPIHRSLEETITALEGGARTVLCNSGLNASALAIMSVCNAGDHLLMVDSVYGPTRNFCDRMLKRFGVETEYFDPSLKGDIAELFRPNTKAVYCESPGSLTFEIQDIPAIAAAAHSKNISVLLDNTWGTPIFFKAIQHGVDLSIQAATKYICGHADVMLGYVTANHSHAKRLSETHGDAGFYVSGDDAFLALRGIRTLPVRLARHYENALRVAQWLQTQSAIEKVLYPPLPSDSGHAIWARDFTGACGLMGVELQADINLSALFNSLKLFGIGYSWGGFESLIVPAHLEQRNTPFSSKGPLIRLHIGLEDSSDLINDLDMALKSAMGTL